MEISLNSPSLAVLPFSQPNPVAGRKFRGYWHSELSCPRKGGWGPRTQITVEQSRKYIVQNLKVLIDVNCLPDMCQMKTHSRIICGPSKSAQNGQKRVKHKSSEIAFLLASSRIMLCSHLAASAETCFKGKVQATVEGKVLLCFPGEKCVPGGVTQKAVLSDKNGEDERGQMPRKLGEPAYKCK